MVDILQRKLKIHLLRICLLYYRILNCRYTFTIVRLTNKLLMTIVRLTTYYCATLSLRICLRSYDSTLGN